MAPLWTSPQVGNQAAIQLRGLSQDPFSMALPQTAAGIGAVGIDPAPEDLAGITTVDGIFQWLGTEVATLNAFKAAMGGTGMSETLIFTVVSSTVVSFCCV